MSPVNGNVRRFPAPGIYERTSEALGNKAEGGKAVKAFLRNPNELITTGQITAIWTIINKNGLDAGSYRDFLQKEFGVASTKKLTQREGAEVIHCLKVLIGEEYEPHMKSLTWGITQPQIRNIRRLAHDLGWDDPKRLDGMIRKMYPPKNRIELLNKREATALIIALEKMIKEGVNDEK